jgi:pescadillo
VKERYPRFIDAVSDMDDALTLTYLYAALPAENDRNVASKYVQKAKTLVAAWGAYCTTTSSITKSFISVKGIYFEAELRNCTTPVRWIVPHAFTQFLPEDVDFKVMNTFLEFYETLLNFILYKLYSDIGVRYPFSVKDIGHESVGSTAALLGANIRALTNALNPNTNRTIGNIVSESVGLTSEATSTNPRTKSEKKKSKELVETVAAALQVLKENPDDDDDDEDMEDDVDIAGPLKAALDNIAEEESRLSLTGVIGAGSAANADIDDEVLKRKRLFAGLTFFMSREVPRGYLELVGLAYGAKVGWEGPDSPIAMNDPSVTHHIVDRPMLPASYDALPKSREYVQPQWILDCANFLFLLPIARYGVGVVLPPHLSPWVDDEEEGYKPKYAEEIERLKNGESVDPEESTATSVNVSTSEADIVSELVDEAPNEDDEDEVESSDDEEMDDDSAKMKELREKKRKMEEDEAQRLAKTMMSRKASHLYGRMQHGLAKKKAKIESLQQRRKELVVDPKDNGKERDGSGRLIITGKEKDKTGKTANKLKVERLKDERKSLEQTYSKPTGAVKKSRKK